MLHSGIFLIALTLHLCIDVAFTPFLLHSHFFIAFKHPCCIYACTLDLCIHVVFTFFFFLAFMHSCCIYACTLDLAIHVAFAHFLLH